MQEDNIRPGTVVAWVLAVSFSVILAFALIIGVGATYRKYNIWSKEQKGRATLAEARFDRQVTIETAKSELEAEKLNAQSEVARAKGAAEAIRIEGGQLTENYIRYLWVRQQKNLSDKTVIYIPTEAGVPILEAGKR